MTKSKTDSTDPIVTFSETPTDPSVAEKQGEAARQEAQAVTAADVKAMIEESKVPEFDRHAPTILLEDGRILEGAAGTGAHDFRVTGTDGHDYDHCADHANGRWIYRRSA